MKLLLEFALHLHMQVTVDINNSLKHLSENGTIILHDCNPEIPSDERRGRCGTVWRAFYQARKLHDIEAFVVDTDYGCGVIRKGTTKLTTQLDDSILNFKFLDSNRVDILNLISVDDFNQRFAI